MKQDPESVSLQKPISRGRKGGRRTEKTTDQKLVQSNICLPAWLKKALHQLIPSATNRNKLFAKWVLILIINEGDSRFLKLEQSSAVLEDLFTYLKATNAPIELQEALQSLIVQQISEKKITEVPNTDYKL